MLAKTVPLCVDCQVRSTSAFDALLQAAAPYAAQDRPNVWTMMRQRGDHAEIDKMLAEGEGFEPPVPVGTVVFKTTAIDHSAIPPMPTEL
jgi:hypothetical protein